MIRILTSLLLVASCHPALAQPSTPRPEKEHSYVQDPKPGDGWFGRLVIHNHAESPTGPVVRLNTKYGTVLVETLITPNAPCLQRGGIQMDECADTWTVSRLPDGVIAIPDSVTITEHKWETIYFYEWTGS